MSHILVLVKVIVTHKKCKAIAQYNYSSLSLWQLHTIVAIIMLCVHMQRVKFIIITEQHNNKKNVHTKYSIILITDVSLLVTGPVSHIPSVNVANQDFY